MLVEGEVITQRFITPTTSVTPHFTMKQAQNVLKLMLGAGSPPQQTDRWYSEGLRCYRKSPFALIFFHHHWSTIFDRVCVSVYVSLAS